MRCVSTAGSTVDLLVSDHGIVVNPNRPDLAAELQRAGLLVSDFDTLKTMAAETATQIRVAQAAAPRLLVEDRTGGMLDWA